MENINNNSELNPFYVTGFSDGESCFHIAIGKNPKYKNGYYVNPGFSIGLHKKDIALLEKIQLYFGGIGTIRREGEFVAYRIFSMKDLKVLIDHFEKYPLITQKQIDYKLFKQVFELIQKKEHLTIQGLQKIVSIRASMNKGLPDSLKMSFPNVIPSSKPLALSLAIQDPNWLTGFVEAEGCFFIKISHNKNKDSYQVMIGFQVSQHSRDYKLISYLVSFLNCGRVEPVNDGFAVNFTVTKLANIIDIIIPFFEKYPLIGAKANDFKDFKKVAELMKSKTHLTKQGLEKIMKIKSNMNSLRVHIE